MLAGQRKIGKRSNIEGGTQNWVQRERDSKRCTDMKLVAREEEKKG